MVYTPKIIENSTDYFLVNPAAVEWCNEMNYLFQLEQLRNIIGFVLIFMTLYILFNRYKDNIELDKKIANKISKGFFNMAFFTLLGYAIYLIWFVAY